MSITSLTKEINKLYSNRTVMCNDYKPVEEPTYRAVSNGEFEPTGETQIVWKLIENPTKVAEWFDKLTVLKHQRDDECRKKYGMSWEEKERQSKLDAKIKKYKKEIEEMKDEIKWREKFIEKNS